MINISVNSRQYAAASRCSWRTAVSDVGGGGGDDVDGNAATGDALMGDAAGSGCSVTAARWSVKKKVQATPAMAPPTIAIEARIIMRPVESITRAALCTLLLCVDRAWI